MSLPCNLRLALFGTVSSAKQSRAAWGGGGAGIPSQTCPTVGDSGRWQRVGWGPNPTITTYKQVLGGLLEHS